MTPPTLADVLTELREMRRDLAGLRDAVRAKRTRASKRTASVAAEAVRKTNAVYQPSEIEVAAAARALAKRRRPA